MIHPPKQFWTSAALPVILGAFLRFWRLGQKSLWGDELLSLFEMERLDSFNSLWQASANAHPKFYFILLRFWSLFGEGEFFWRFLSAIFGVMAIYLTYLLARIYWDRRVALTAALLVAIHPLLLLYDREVRMYPLLVCFSLMSLYSFERALQTRQGKWWVWYFVANLLNIYTHYHAFLVLGSQGAVVLFGHMRERRIWLSAVACWALLALCYLPWLPALLHHSGHISPWAIEGARFPTLLGWWSKPLYVGASLLMGQTLLPWRVLYIASSLSVGVLLLMGVYGLGPSPRSFRLGCYTVLPVLMGVTFSHAMPRYYVFALPLLMMVLASTVAIASRRFKRVALTAMAIWGLGLGAGIVNYYGHRDYHILAHIDPWREVADTIARERQPDDVVIGVGGLPLFHYVPQYHVGSNLAELRPHIRKWQQGPPTATLFVVLAEPQAYVPGEVLRNWMDKNALQMDERKFLHDPDHARKQRFFKKQFLEYRIRLYRYRADNPS